MGLSKELTVEHVDGEIRISIGVELLSFAIEHAPRWDNGWIADPDNDYKDFAESIIAALQHEEEDGTTLLHVAFDAAAEHALEQGYEGFVSTE